MAPPLVCPVRRPTAAQMADGAFESYVESMEDDMQRTGCGKISAPAGWCPCATPYDSLDLEIPQPIRQHITGRGGFYRTLLVEQRPMSLKEFRPVAEAEAHASHRRAAAAPTTEAGVASSAPPREDDEEDAAAERAFWKSVTRAPALYGADVSGSLFDPNKPGWNLKRGLDTLLSRTLNREDVHIPGVMSPYLYFGAWRSVFAYHTEDYDLYSVNYLHTGAPKTWYFIPPSARDRFEELAKGYAPDLFQQCRQFLRHKELLFSPQFLRQHSIPFVKVVQRPGDFILTFPGAYHAGFNHGFNIAESTNFATRRWLPIGRRALPCTCVCDTVRIDMGLFKERDEDGCGARHARQFQYNEAKRARLCE